MRWWDREAHTRKQILPISHLRHTSDKTCNVKAEPNNRLQPTPYSVRCASAFRRG